MNAPHPLKVMDTQALLTPEQVSMRLGITPETLQAWRTCNRYDLPYVKVGRLIRYRNVDIERFIARRTKSHTGSPYAGARMPS